MKRRSKGFPHLSKEELSKLKIIDGYKLHTNCLCLTITAPSTPGRYTDKKLQEKDRRFLTGIVWTFPFDYQLELLELVLDNKVYDQPRNEYIDDVVALCDRLRPENQVPEKPAESPYIHEWLKGGSHSE